MGKLITYGKSKKIKQYFTVYKFGAAPFESSLIGGSSSRGSPGKNSQELIDNKFG